MKKKYILLEVGYEYNDNTYDKEGIKLYGDRYDTSPLFVGVDTKEEADKVREKLVKDFVYGKYEYICQYLREDICDKIIEITGRNSESEHSWDYTLPKKLSKEKWKEIYNLIKEEFFLIEEVDDTETINIVTKVDDLDFDISLRESKKGYVYHNESKSALKYTTRWGDKYEDFYLNGKKFEQESEWRTEARKTKIDKVVKE